MVNPSARIRLRQQGLSLVELMVGLAIGLVVVAAASLLVSAQLGDNRRLMIETQLQQDMRAAADIIAREIRRAGTQADLATLQTLWYPGTSGVRSNLFAENVVVAASEVTFEYRPEGGSTDELFGFKLENDSVKTKLGGIYQELTDSNVLKVTEFTITPAASSELRLPCPKPCSDGTTNCWPKVQVREMTIAITAEARNLPEIRRTLTSSVRLRNDHVHFFNPGANLICPT